ncbi:MAG: MFS transporter [Alphaproteobacteria bacterium]|nr:MFS transporter [Alphaproteobacteria bacterium]MDE2111886.1 MFS transporter [Alphaproteobacteria bacterium]
MAYFRNRTVNLLNVHYGIHSLALTGSGAFYTVFLLKAGVPVPAVLLSLAAILAGRFFLRPAVLPLAKRFGLKPLLVCGTIGSGLQYPFLAEVHGVGAHLYMLIAVAAVADALYWTTYHAYFAAHGDAEHRGQQISVREATAAIIGIAGPLIGGWALVTLGPRIAFRTTAVVLLCAAIPVLFTPNVKIAKEAPNAFRKALPGVLLFVADGWIACGLVFVWQLALFISLGENFQTFGGAMAIAALVGAVSGLLLGRFIDDGHGRRAAWIALGILVLTTVIRAASYGDAVFAVVANAFGSLIACLYLPTMMTAVYNQSKRSPCVARFHIAAEGGWDVGGSTALATAAGLLSAGAPMGAVILISLAGAFFSFFLLRGYYTGDARASAAAIGMLAGADALRSPEPDAFADAKDGPR